MPDWAIVLVAAFGGGLAGAVLEPVATHVLERIRSGAEIRKRRERRLRHMLESRMIMATRLVSRARQIVNRQDAGTPMTPGEKLDRLIDPSDEGPIWQPERIEDPVLRRVAPAYADVAFRLFTVLLSVIVDAAEVERLIEQLEKLRLEISLRMDELNWPEVDE